MAGEGPLHRPLCGVGTYLDITIGKLEILIREELAAEGLFGEQIGKRRDNGEIIA